MSELFVDAVGSSLLINAVSSKESLWSRPPPLTSAMELTPTGPLPHVSPPSYRFPQSISHLALFPALLPLLPSHSNPHLDFQVIGCGTLPTTQTPRSWTMYQDSNSAGE